MVITSLIAGTDQMDRRSFFGTGFSGLAFANVNTGPQSMNAPVVVEREEGGQPRRGKVLTAIQPHADDIPLFAAGTVAKLIDEGATGYLIRITNDDKTGPGTVGEGVKNNEADNYAVSKALGCRKVYDFNYRNHNLDEASSVELRGRLIFLFRLLQADIVICYDPWSLYEENPDHYMTARAVEGACWMAGMSKDYPEHLDAGIKPHAVTERYYFARGPQLVNRVVDITSTVERKIDSLLVNQTQGPAGTKGAELRASLAEKGLKLPLLGNDDRTANREYIRQFILVRDAEAGREFNLKYAERFHYVGPPDTSDVLNYVRQHAVPLK